MYDPNAYEDVMDNAPPEIAYMSQDVADRINGPAADLFLTGQEISWMAGVFPSLSSGKVGPFQTTGTAWRRQVYQMLPALLSQIQLMCGIDPQSCEGLYQMMPDMAQMVDEISFGMVYSLARMVG